MTAVPARAPDRESLFLRIADWVPAAMGRPANIIVCMIAVAAWTLTFAAYWFPVAAASKSQ